MGNLIDRQEAIECRQEDYPPLIMFAEGTTSNGARIMPFKRGAFAGMRTVTPVYQRSTNCHDIAVTFDSIGYFALKIMILSSLSFRHQKLQIMPDFTPTPWMLEKHADKGSEPWEIYAWCVRDAISKFSGVATIDYRLKTKDRIAFEALMQGK